MFYEYALISVIIASGYWGIFFLRRQPSGTPTFGIMQLAAAGLAGLGLYGALRGDACLGAPADRHRRGRAARVGPLVRGSRAGSRAERPARAAPALLAGSSARLGLAE